jgi:hypothetical protein
MAREQYGGSVDAYKQAAIEALESLDGERETEAEPEAGV